MGGPEAWVGDTKGAAVGVAGGVVWVGVVGVVGGVMVEGVGRIWVVGGVGTVGGAMRAEDVGGVWDGVGFPDVMRSGVGSVDDPSMSSCGRVVCVRVCVCLR